MHYIPRIEKDGSQHTLPPVASYDRTDYLPGSEAARLAGRVGITLDFPGGLSVRLPEDADKVYMMNAGGDTIDTIKWPPAAGQLSPIERDHERRVKLAASKQHEMIGGPNPRRYDP